MNPTVIECNDQALTIHPLLTIAILVFCYIGFSVVFLWTVDRISELWRRYVTNKREQDDGSR